MGRPTGWASCWRTATPAAGAPALTAGARRSVRLEQAKRLFTGRAVAEIELEHVVEGLEAPTARRARPFATPTRSPATRPSTPGARRCSCIGGTCRCCRAVGRRRCRRARARPRSCRVSWARTTTSRCCSRSPASRRSEPRAGGPRGAAALCRTCQAELRAEAKPRGERLFAERPDELKERVISTGHRRLPRQPWRPPRSRLRGQGAGKRRAAGHGGKLPGRVVRPSQLTVVSFTAAYAMLLGCLSSHGPRHKAN